MTVASRNNKHVYVGNGVNRVWPYTFVLPNAAYLNVYLKTGDASAVLLSPGDYFINEAAMTVTYPLGTLPALGADKKIILLREVLYTQEIDLINQGDFYAETIEGGFDHNTMLAQQLAERADRALEVPLGDPRDPAVFIEDFFIAVAAAETSAQNAAASETAAETAQAGAETARTGAETARARAERAEGAAALSERNAKISEDAAEFAASEAAASEVSARNYLNMITDTGSSLPEAIMQNNLNVNSSFDRIEVTEAELVDIEKVVLNAELSTRMSAMRAAQSETNARISASESAAAKTAAEFARNESQSARNDSQAARNDSRIAKAAAETAAGNAASSETAAQRAQAGAGTAQTGAETARTGAETARASAERAEGAAEAARDAASVSEANAQRTYFNVAQLALQLGNSLLALENQNTLAEAILQENLLINNIYDRLEGGIYAAI